MDLWHIDDNFLGNNRTEVVGESGIWLWNDMLGIQLSYIQSLHSIHKTLGVITPTGRKRKNSSKKTETDEFQTQVRWCLPFISGFGRLRQWHWWAFKYILGYLVHSRSTWAAEWLWLYKNKCKRNKYLIFFSYAEYKFEWCV